MSPKSIMSMLQYNSNATIQDHWYEPVIVKADDVLQILHHIWAEAGMSWWIARGRLFRNRQSTSLGSSFSQYLLKVRHIMPTKVWSWQRGPGTLPYRFVTTRIPNASRLRKREAASQTTSRICMQQISRNSCLSTDSHQLLLPCIRDHGNSLSTSIRVTIFKSTSPHFRWPTSFASPHN